MLLARSTADDCIPRSPDPSDPSDPSHSSTPTEGDRVSVHPAMCRYRAMAVTFIGSTGLLLVIGLAAIAGHRDQKRTDH